MNVFTIEYSLQDRTNWKTCVVADDSQKAIAFISRLLGGASLNVTTISTIGKVDGISDEIIERILQKFNMKREEINNDDVPLYDEERPKRVRGKRIGDK